MFFVCRLCFCCQAILPNSLKVPISVFVGLQFFGVICFLFFFVRCFLFCFFPAIVSGLLKTFQTFGEFFRAFSPSYVNEFLDLDTLNLDTLDRNPGNYSMSRCIEQVLPGNYSMIQWTQHKNSGNCSFFDGIPPYTGDSVRDLVGTVNRYNDVDFKFLRFGSYFHIKWSLADSIHSQGLKVGPCSTHPVTNTNKKKLEFCKKRRLWNFCSDGGLPTPEILEEMVSSDLGSYRSE